MAWMLLLECVSRKPQGGDIMLMRPQGWLCLSAVAMFASGCALTSENVASARPVRLPTGVTLLDSDRKECDGSVAIDERAVSKARRSDLVLQRGQNAIIEVDANSNDD